AGGRGRKDRPAERPIVGEALSIAAVGAAVTPDEDGPRVALVGCDHVVVLALGRSAPEDPPRAVEGQPQLHVLAIASLRIGPEALSLLDEAAGDPAASVEDERDCERPLAPPV